METEAFYYVYTDSVKTSSRWAVRVIAKDVVDSIRQLSNHYRSWQGIASKWKIVKKVGQEETEIAAGVFEYAKANDTKTSSSGAGTTADQQANAGSTQKI